MTVVGILQLGEYWGKMAFWHSSSHVLAQVLEEFYPGIKLTIGQQSKMDFIMMLI